MLIFSMPQVWIYNMKIKIAIAVLAALAAAYFIAGNAGKAPAGSPREKALYVIETIPA